MNEQEDMFLSHDVTSLFSKTSIDYTLHVIRKRLEVDSILTLRTHIQVDDTIDLK